MKIIKQYKLSEENLEKDLDGFIMDAKNGAYQYDYKYGQEGLKLIKVYFRMIEEEFKKQNYQIARVCYKKLMFLLLQSEHNYFNYEDIVGKLNFDKFLTNYFICLIKQCNIEELFKEYLEYLKTKEGYYFEPVHKTIFTNLSEENLKGFVGLVEKTAENIKEKDYGMYDLIYFLLDLVKFRKDVAEFDRLCQKYKGFVDEDEPFDEKD
jgi:hypothetical protein